MCNNGRVGQYFAQVGLIAVERNMLRAESTTNRRIICAEEEGEEADVGCGRIWDDGGEDVKNLF